MPAGPSIRIAGASLSPHLASLRLATWHVGAVSLPDAVGREPVSRRKAAPGGYNSGAGRALPPG